MVTHLRLARPCGACYRAGARSHDVCHADGMSDVMCTCLYSLTCESATSRCIRMRSSTFCSSSLRMSSFRFVPRCTSRLSCAMHDTATH